MFSHFIYFIIALLILSLYTPPEELPISLFQSIFFLLGTAFLFGFYSYAVFRRLAKKVGSENPVKLDQQFTILSTRCSILALVVLAIDVWWLHLPTFLDSFALFSALPTLSSLVLLILFVGYLALLWTCSYHAHRAIYHTDITLGNYVGSNVAFSVPVLIPWTLLFGIHDIIGLLPFSAPKALLTNPIGQTAYFLIFLMIAAIFAPVLVQRFWRCRPLEPGVHRERIEVLCRQAGVKYANIVYWPIFGGRMITAGVMGLVARYRYILVTKALLSILTPDEIDQVIAHEIGHVKHRHLILYLLFFIGFMLISYTVYPLSKLILVSQGPILEIVTKFNLDIITAVKVLNGIFLIICVIFYFRYIFGYFIRNFERQADLFVFELFTSARPLISTFDKITASSGQPADKPNWHHFSIQQRIDYLWRCEQTPEWISRHTKKVNKSIAAFVVAFIILGMALYQVNEFADAKIPKSIRILYSEAQIEWMETEPEKLAILCLGMGDVFLKWNDMGRAASAYETSLILNPAHPTTLNNLAWLLATSPDSPIYNPKRSLELARQAIAIQEAPHIWDTLAQSLFVNGLVEKAIAAQRKAIDMKPKDKKTYEDQLAKFMDALKKDAP